MHYTEEQLMEAFEKLPKEIQEAIADANTEVRINAIGNRHKLHVDQIGELANQTGLVMLGLVHPNQFVENLARRVGLSSVEAETIAQEINAEVLIGIREAIKKLADENQKKQESSETVPTPTTETPKPQNVFEQKVGKMFSLPSEKDDTNPVIPTTESQPNRIWESDPYLERP